MLKLADGIFKLNYWNDNLTNPLLSSSLEYSFLHYSNDFTNSMEVYHGYFKPPVDGVYCFYMTCDGYSELWLSSTSNSTNTSFLQNIITWTSPTNGLSHAYNILKSPQITMEKNQYYLLQAFRPLYTNAGNINLGVELPKIQNNFMDSIQYIRISYQPVREKLELKIYNWMTGTFKIVVEGRDPTTGNVVYKKETQALDYNITESNLTSILANQMGWGRASLKRMPLNKTGDAIVDIDLLNQTAGFLFQINLTVYREHYQGIQYMPRVVILTNNVLPKTSFIQTQSPSLYITGDYTLKFGDILMENINANLSNLNEYLKKIPQYSRYFTCEMFGNIYEDRTYVIKLVGMPVPVPLFEVNSFNLQGGDPLTPPQMVVSSIMDASSNAFYSSIPDDLLYQADPNPQANVYVNTIASKCPNDNCQYIVSATKSPKLKEYNVTSEGLSLLIENYEDYEINSDSLTISFALSNCSITSIELPYINCSIPLNSDGSLLLSAGHYKPLIHIEKIGFALYDEILTDIAVDLNVKSLSLNKGSIMGGQNITITGKGFPQCKTDLNVSIGLSNATVLESSNDQITIITQEQTDTSTIVIIFNDVTATNDEYQYDETITPFVNSISPSSSSPVQKAELIIEGTGFGDDIEKIKVFLDYYGNSSLSYELNVVSLVNGEILAILGGGKAGKYSVRVDIDSIGSTKPLTDDANIFYYDLVILSINPTFGSIMGGTLLNIQGVNFSPNLNQNQVFIGENINQFCDVIFSNSTNLECITRVAPEEYQEINKSLVVAQRVQEEGRCGIEECSFTYTRDSTPEISFDSNEIQIFNVTQGDIITLIGSKLMNEDGKGYINFLQDGQNKNRISTNTLQDDGLSFVIPAMIEGFYTVSIEIPNKGFVFNQNQILIHNLLVIKEAKINDGADINANGSKGGVLLDIYGNGFLETDVISIQNNIGNCLRLNAYDSTRIQCKTKALPTESTNYTIYLVRNSSYKITCEQCIFQVLSVMTPIATSHNMTSITNQSNFIINIKGTNLDLSSSTILLTLDLFDTTKLIKRYQGEILIINSTNVLANFVNIPAGKYSLSGYYKEFGYISLPTSLQPISINHFEIVSSVNKLETGYFGGPNLFLSSPSVNFPSFDENFDQQMTIITICGFLCEINEIIDNVLTCQTPKLSTQKTLDYYQISENELINDFTVSGDLINSLKNVNDGLLSTFYDSGNNYCFLEFDFGAEFLVKLENIIFYFNNRKTLINYYGLVFQYSLDGSNYIDFLTIEPSSLISGKNIYKFPNNLPPLRSIKLNSSILKIPGRCNLAEIEFIGTRFHKNSGDSIDSLICDVTVNSYGRQFILPQIVQYSELLTPKITSISPEMTTSLGGTTLTILGSNFGTETSVVNVLIDGVQCTISSVTINEIICVTGKR